MNTENSDSELPFIDDVIKQLEDIKGKYGNLKVGQIFYATDENKQGKDEIDDVIACVVTNPIEKNKYMVVFD